MNRETCRCKINKGDPSMSEEDSDSYAEYDNLHELLDLLLDGGKEFEEEDFSEANEICRSAIKEGEITALTTGEDRGVGNV